jgi:hypothetical protein
MNNEWPSWTLPYRAPAYRAVCSAGTYLLGERHPATVSLVWDDKRGHAGILR